MKIKRFRSCIAGVLSTALFSGAVVAQGNDIPMQLMASGAFYVKASLDSRVNTDMLLDTGSGYVSLSDETFGKIKDEPGTVFQRYITGMMADGKASRVPVYLISELKLSEHCVLRDIEVAVLRNATRDILGLSALRQLQPLTLQLDPPVMTATCG
ncbi:MAG: retroviral-like aspartic protease family protein [Pseudomonadales bacterium]